MYELFSQLMQGFSLDNPLEYICGFLLFIVVVGVFSASCIRSLSRIRWRVKKCLRVSLRLLTGFFRPF